METYKLVTSFYFVCSILYCASQASVDAQQQLSGPFVSPFTEEQNSVPSYMVDIYRKLSNPRKKICHDRTYVSLPNKANTPSSICSTGKITFSLRRDSEKGRFLRSARVYMELLSALAKDQRPDRKVIVALSFKNNDTLLGYTEIETGKYDSIDITAEARHWWDRNEYEAPEMNINFYISHPWDMKESCDDIFWRVSILVSWQNKRRCKRRLRKPRHKPYSELVLEDPAMDDTDFEEEEEEDAGDESYLTLRELTTALKESKGLRKITERQKRSVSAPQLTDLLQGQKKIFFNSLNKEEKEVKAEAPSKSFTEIFLKYLLNNEKTLVQRAEEFIQKKNGPTKGLQTTSKPQKNGTTEAPGRTNRHTQSKKNYKSCAMKKKIINFKTLHLDWILAPTEYRSGRCTGGCQFPISEKSNPTNFSIFSSIQRYFSGRGRYPCCTPSKMESMTLLLRDTNGQIVIQNVDDMIIKSCGCR